MIVCTNSRDRRRGTGRKRKGNIRRKGDSGELTREDKYIYQYAHIYSSSENSRTLNYRGMPCTSLVGHAVVMATQAVLSSRQVSGVTTATAQLTRMTLLHCLE